MNVYSFMLCPDKTTARPTARSETREPCENHTYHIRDNGNLTYLSPKQLNTFNNTNTAVI